MFHPILKIDEHTDISNGYFFDHLHNQLYLVKAGKLVKKSLDQPHTFTHVPLDIYFNQNTQTIFPSLLTVKGECKYNLQNTSFVTLDNAKCSVRTNLPITDGSVWQWHITGSLKNVKLGVVEMTKNNNQFETYVDIVASSSRTVTFSWVNGQLRTWVNGRALSREHTKELAVNTGRQSQFFPLVTCEGKGQTIIFNPFGRIPNQPQQIKFRKQNADLKSTQNKFFKDEVSKITQLNKDKFLLVSKNERVKVIHRNLNTNQFEFPHIRVSEEGRISGIFSDQEWGIITKDGLVQEFWSPFKIDSGIIANELKSALQKSVNHILLEKAQNQTLAYRILLQKICILRSFSSQFSLKNLIYESELDREHYSETSNKQYFQLSQNLINNVSKAVILNQTGWYSPDGKISDVTENYILSIDQETVIIQHIGDSVKEVFRENIVFFEFNKNSFLESYKKSDLKNVTKGQKNSSIYKILANCFSKQKKIITELYTVKQIDLKEMINDYRISQSEAKLSLEQTGNVEDALVWLSQPAQERVYISKHEEHKGKTTDQLVLDGRLLELKQTPFVKLVLNVNKQLYLLGYDPESLSKNITRSEKQFINLFDFKRQSTIQQIDQSHWFNSQNHQKLTILDSVPFKQDVKVLSRSQKQIFVIVSREGKNYRAQLKINSGALFENQPSLILGTFELFESSNSIKLADRQVLYPQNLVDFKCLNLFHTFFFKEQLYTFLSTNTQKITEIQVLAENQTFKINDSLNEKREQTFIPLAIEKGPIGCNMNYEISSILTPNSSFLANYPQQIKFKNQHSKFMKITSIIIQREHKKMTVNQLKQAWIHFQNQAGVRSQKYHVQFQQNDTKKQLKINSEGFWRYIVLTPVFENGKRMPYEFGFFGVKGSLIQNQIYEELLYKKVEQSIKIYDSKNLQNLKEFEVKNVTQVSNNVLKINLKTSQPLQNLQIKVQSPFKTVLSINNKSILKPDLTKEEEQQTQLMKNLQKLSSKQLSKLFEKSHLHLKIMKQIAKRQKFSFKNWESNEIRKFIDLTFLKGNDLKKSIFANLFDKILLNQQGKKYIDQLCQNMGKCHIAFPENHLFYLIGKMNASVHKQNLRSLMDNLKHLKSQGYNELKKQKIPYLLLEENFYSNFYLQEIEKTKKKPVLEEDAKVKIFQEESIIPCQFVVTRDDCSRKIYVKIDNCVSISSLALRFDRTQTSSRVNYKIYSLAGQRKLLKKGSISEQQWAQITKLSQSSQMKNLYKNDSSLLNAFTIQLGQRVQTDLVEIQILYSQTGILANQLAAKSFPFIDIIPQIYGQVNNKIKNSQTERSFPQILDFFNINQQESFYLATVDLSYTPLQKYSVSKENQNEYNYFKPASQKLDILRRNIVDRIQKKDYLAAIPDHKKLVQSKKSHAQKVNLDYVYTLLVLTLDQIFKNQTILEEDLCQNLFLKLVQQDTGPIKIAAFKAISNSVTYLINSLPHMEQQGFMPNLEKVTFKKSEIESILDLKNIPLCHSLNKLVVNCIPYQNEWAKFLIKLTPVTQRHQENIKYILKSNKDWHEVQQILGYFQQIPENYFTNVLLANIEGSQLQKFILNSKKHNKTLRTHLLIDKLIQIYKEKIDLDIVSMMLEQKDVKWHNLYKIITVCPEAEDLILTQFLQTAQQNPEKLAESYPEILIECGKSAKHSQNFSSFLRKLFEKNRNQFKKSILNLQSSEVSLHSDMIQVLTFYLYEQCNFGGIEGCKLLKQEQLLNIYVALLLIKKIDFSSIDSAQFREINQEDILIEWYFCNNSYQLTNVNPANKSPAMHLMKSLSEKVLQLIENRPIQKILRVFDRLIKQIQSEFIPLSTKHIYINQINEGVSQLLGKSINPSSLSEILVGKQNNQMLQKIFQSLKALNSKQKTIDTSIDQESQWKNPKQIDFIEKFAETSNIKQKVKDWQTNRNGSKNILFKVPLSEDKILLKSSNSQGFILSKILIGFTTTDNPQKNNIYPSGIQVYGGEKESNLTKICELKQIQDQHFQSFSTKVYGVNLNSLPFRKCATPIQTIEIRMSKPFLTSVSDVFENSQKVKINAFYSVSFLSLMGYETQPKIEPAYNQIYMTLLSFLSDQKYHQTLARVIKSDFYKQKSNEFLKLLNSLLPNKQIENLLLALNKQNQDVLGSVFEYDKPNIQLIELLLQANPSGQNIKKILKYFILNQSEKLSPILVSAIKMFSYSNPNQKIDVSIQVLLEKYEAKSFNGTIFKILAAILSSPSNFTFDYLAWIQNMWKAGQNKRVSFYKLVGATIAYNNEALEAFLSKGKTAELVTQLLAGINERKPSVHNQIYLLSQLSLHVQNRQYLIDNDIPITLVNSLRNDETLIVKDYGSSMKYFILVFQSTCIQSKCEQRFSEILIDLMVKLPQVSALHHNFFIHEFFFPLINGFKGIPVKFIWKNGKGEFLNQATHSLIKKPIKYDDNIVVVNGLYLEKTKNNDWTQISNKQNYVVLNKNNEIMDRENTEISNKPQCEYKLFKIINQETSQLLTNQTLIKLKNLGIFGSKYLNNLPVQDSTFQKIYYIPCEMTLTDILKQVNICGFKINQDGVKKSNFVNYNTKQRNVLQNEKSLDQILTEKQKHFAEIEVNPEPFFSTTTIEQIVKKPVEHPIFIPQLTIFKTFEKKQGLLKMITVLKTCVKNWTNKTQSKIWEQYLNELQSYSCFPVFSSIYMNKQENVQLLFDILSGLPNKEDSKKWIELEKTSVKFLYNIIKDVFQVEGSKALQIRKYAVEKGFYKTMLQRLHLVSKQPKRVKVQEEKQEQELQVPTDIKKIASEQDYKLKVVKKKGIGYGNDSSSNQKWDVTGQQQSRKQVSNQILELLKILEKFLDHRMFEPPTQIIEQSFESALLPILESSLRGGSLLEISKSAELFKGQLSFIKALARKKSLVPILMAIPKFYEPKQHQSIVQLLKVLESTSKIFLSCLTGSVSEKLSEEIAKGIIETYELVQAAVSNYQQDHVDEDEQKKILQLPLAKKYPLLLKDLRFDYVDMKDKNGKISKHHYSSNFVQNHKNPPAKTIRLAQQLADISHALPVEHTNAIYVRCDKERVDFMQALIMGSNGTPYGHGAYLFDIYFDDTYPNNPPKVNLTTTGNGQIRFNPNLYSCGKVCLSLLGTWRGSAMENWDPKVSTLLQILVSIQSIIMSEQVYFNEPGFQHQQGTIEGQKKNEAYANIVRYGNIKFAMIENIKNPPKGFEHIIKRHFYLKKDEILEQTKKWLKYAEKREASYNGLVSDHNNNWSNTFKKSKTEYKTMLQKAIKELEEELNKLPQPSHKDLKPSVSSPKKQKKKTVKIVSKDENIQQVDVEYDKMEQTNLKQLDINDEKVKDRWSRYIGAMGIEAVSKQSKASIILFGLGSTGVEIAKNIILSGCKKISIVDENNTSLTDLSGQFFLGEEDIGKNRVDACLYKLQELNHYVRVQNMKFSQENLEVLKQYDVVILTEQPLSRQKIINKFCHQNQIKFIITDCYGPFGQHFNDFGQDFQVLDKNGQETVQVMIQSITNAEKGVVTLLNKQRHPYEDGQAVRITGVKGMVKQNGESINGTIHKIRVINQYSFEIGNTTEYSAYQVDGLARNMKIPIKVQFKSFEESLKISNVDNNLAFYDFEKSTKNTILHNCFITLNNFREKHNKYPQPWNWEDGQTFLSMLKEIYSQELKAPEINFIRTFAYTCSGNFAPLAAFYGGLTAQQTFKAITGKYMPINQYFFTQFTEVVPSLPQSDAEIQNLLQEINYKETADNRNEGLRRIVGNELIQAIEKCRVFVIGSGAIGCQLLKNYAMINLATSKTDGEIIVTDPDHIEESNLNRQFLFRQKHLRKPKSVTAAAAVSQMNKLLKGKIRAKLDRVCESTKDIFSNEFFESLNIVTNALDNVKARQYVDQRCVENKVALLQSGTLSSKGHVQVILPYLTETYGSKNDPAEEGQIPHCTLKMFPEQTLHCVEWARDIFGKTFTLDPKALGKLLQKWKEYTPTSSDLEMLKSCSKLLDKKPNSFEEAIEFATIKFYELYRNDIKQLLYTYPLDAKTKDGKPFWKLPKRPPTPIEEIDPKNQFHSTFITSYAVLLCKIFNVEHPKDFRKEERKVQICTVAAKIKIDPFIPNDKLAKQMAQEVEKNENTEQKQQMSEEPKQIESEVIIDENGIFDNIKKVIEQSETEIKVNAEEFQKDDDQNGHIDLIYSMANLRANNYKLEPMDWMATKLKAGRITPALSTTTSCVAALQTIQLIKYLKKCKLDKMRNTFINLAVPMIQAGEPGQVQKIKIHENLTTNIWERWQIGPINLDKITIGELLSNIQEKYKIQVKILSILEGAQIYSDLVYGLQSKKQEKEEYLRKSLKDILLNQIPAEDLKKFIDMTLVFGVNDELAKHVPTLRIKLEQ